MARSQPQREPFSSRALFERCSDPVFVLNQRRRLRYANPALEKLAGRALEDLYNLHCVRDRRAEPLAQALAPPPEVMSGAPGQARRPVPPARVGPPWWDASFLPMKGDDGLLAIVGRIAVIGATPPAKPRVLPEGLVQLRQRLTPRFAFSDF